MTNDKTPNPGSDEAVKAGYRIVAVNNKTNELRDIAIVYSEYLAVRLCRYIGPSVNLTTDENLQVFPVQLPNIGGN